MVEMVRGNLKPLQRSVMGALIVLDVHGKDVVAANEEHLQDQGREHQ